MFGGRQRSIFVGNNNNGKVYPYSPEQDFTFGNDEDSIQKNDSIVWGEVDDDSLTINVKASPKNNNNNNTTSHLESKSATLHFQNQYEEIDDSDAQLKNTNEVAFGAVRQQLHAHEMKNIEKQLQDAVFDSKLVSEEKSNSKLSKKDQFEHCGDASKHDKVASFTGHTTTTEGTHYVKPRPPPGTMLISHQQLKAMKDTLKKAYKQKVKDIKKK